MSDSLTRRASSVGVTEGHCSLLLADTDSPRCVLLGHLYAIDAEATNASDTRVQNSLGLSNFLIYL